MNSDELSKKLKADLQEQQKRIDKAWEQIESRRRRSWVIMMFICGALLGLSYLYLHTFYFAQ